MSNSLITVPIIDILVGELESPAYWEKIFTSFQSCCDYVEVFLTDENIPFQIVSNGDEFQLIYYTTNRLF